MWLKKKKGIIRYGTAVSACHAVVLFWIVCHRQSCLGMLTVRIWQFQALMMSVCA
jgi:hypothetical protein